MTAGPEGTETSGYKLLTTLVSFQHYLFLCLLLFQMILLLNPSQNMKTIICVWVENNFLGSRHICLEGHMIYMGNIIHT